MLVAVENVLLQKTKNRNLSAVTSVSAHCSPVSNKRHKLHTSTVSLTSSCSSQMNNNYTTGIDMNSLEDMLRKVRSFTILISCRLFVVVKFVKWCVAMCASPSERSKTMEVRKSTIRGIGIRYRTVSQSHAINAKRARDQNWFQWNTKLLLA